MPRQQPRTSRKPNRPRTLSAKQQRFIDALSQNGNLLLSSKICDQPRNHHDKWIAKEKTVAKKRGEQVEEYPYHAAFATAQEDSVQRLEAIARRRAESVVKKFKFCREVSLTNPETDEPYYELEHDTALLMFLLKAMKPEKYREKSSSPKSGKSEQRPAGEIVVYMPDNRRQESGAKPTVESAKPEEAGGTS